MGEKFSIDWAKVRLNQFISRRLNRGVGNQDDNEVFMALIIQVRTLEEEVALLKDQAGRQSTEFVQ